MTTPAVRISGLSKAYDIQHQSLVAANTLREAFTQKLRKPFGRGETERFWALKDIDLDIKEGEVVGVIGRNGAGKSTLLKILSRITEPTTGKIELYGRVGALLEVGTGFHPELSGRENIFLNGAILGMRRPEIKKQFEAIVDFAGVEKFLDTAVKRYSSGMYVRLAFAVAAHLNPEILIVDEVLAVGDAEFQKKCLGKMQDVAASGRTVLFVSHNMNAIETLCDRGILLESGGVKFIGPVADALETYACRRSSHPTKLKRSRFEDTGTTIEAVEMSNADGTQVVAIRLEESFRLSVRIRSSNTIFKPRVGIAVINWSGQRMCRLNTDDCGFTPDTQQDGTIHCDVPGLPFRPGHYSIAVGLSDGDQPLDRVDNAFEFEILSADIYGTGRDPFGPGDTVFIRSDWTCTRP